MARSWVDPNTWFRVLRNDGFTVGYSDLRGNPLWVSYRLARVAENAPNLPRPQRFERDWRNLTGIGHDDYRGSGFDRGHMAPNYAIGRLYGRHAQRQTFLMTNVSPQRPRLNQKVWQRLEETAVNHFTARFSSVWVIAGPVFEGRRERLRSSFRVEIPDAFYKIFAVPGDPVQGVAPRMLAFLIPQAVGGGEPLDRFLVSVDEVEARTGLDFFPYLHDELEESLEAAIRPESWGPKRVLRLAERH